MINIIDPYWWNLGPVPVRNEGLPRIDIGGIYKLSTNAVALTNFKHKCSIVVIGLTTSAEEFQNTFDHEKGHLAMHISSALKIKPYGEEYQYLTGEIGQSMFKIAKRFLCDDCRQKLVIEIKEIDKKD